MKLKKPPSYDHVEFPTRKRLMLMDKVPQPLSVQTTQQKMSKHLEWMRGPEPIHNKIEYGEYGVQALGGGRLHHGHLEAIRLVIIRKMDDRRMFAHWRVDAPWQPVVKKGIGHRMGGGKGSIDRYEIPIKPDRIVLEVGGRCEFEEVEPFLRTITSFLPFPSRVVSRKSLEEDEKNKERLEKLNQNPFTFKYCAEKNMLGIDTYLSPYDYHWHGKYR